MTTDLTSPLVARQDPPPGEPPTPEFRPFSLGTFRLSASGPRGCSYQARLAHSPQEVRAAQTLRFEVFNLELKEGLPQSYATGLDADPFDAVCDHLLVEELGSGQLVGTYRLQPGTRAAAHLGYYSAQEFDLHPFASARAELIELGRACVAKAHRNLCVIQLLWRGLAFYARALGARYLFGCSSLNGTEPVQGAALYAALAARYLAPTAFRTQPVAACACPLDFPAGTDVEAPRLLRAYLALGARIAGRRPSNRQFGSIDFLTLLDLQSLSPHIAGKYSNSPPAFGKALAGIV